MKSNYGKVYKPSNLAIVGCAGCGKTNHILNLLMDDEDHDEIHIFTRPHVPLYEMLPNIHNVFIHYSMDEFEQVFEQHKTKLDTTMLIVFDEMIETQERDEIINKHIMYFRRYGIHSIITYQDKYTIPKFIQNHFITDTIYPNIFEI